MLLHDALSLWRGAPYAGFEDVEALRAEQIRLEELHLQAIEAHAEALLACGEPNRAITELEAFVLEHPLRAEPQATLMRALVAIGRDAEALRVFQDAPTSSGRRAGSGAVTATPTTGGVDPAAATRTAAPRTAAPGGDRTAVLSIDGLSLQRLTGDGIDLAWGDLGVGSPVVVVPAWVSNLELIADGRDPRSSVIEHLAAQSPCDHLRPARHGVVGRRRFAISASRPPSASSRRCWIIVGEPAALFAMSGAGPIALACAARRPDRVSHLVLFGTYASGPRTFGDVGRPILDLLRQRPNIATELLAGLYRPGASGAATLHFARILRESAPTEVAAGYLEAIYDTDVTDLVDEIRAPALVLHYRGDRVIPFAGGETLAAALPSARFIAEGRRVAPARCPRRRRHHRRRRGPVELVSCSHAATVAPATRATRAAFAMVRRQAIGRPLEPST